MLRQNSPKTAKAISTMPSERMVVIILFKRGGPNFGPEGGGEGLQGINWLGDSGLSLENRLEGLEGIGGKTLRSPKGCAEMEK